MVMTTLGFYSHIFPCIDPHLCRPEPKASADATPVEWGSSLAAAGRGEQSLELCAWGFQQVGQGDMHTSAQPQRQLGQDVWERGA